MAQKNDNLCANAKVVEDGRRQPLLEKLARDLENTDSTVVKSKQTLFAALGDDAFAPPTPLPAPKGRIPKLPKVMATVTRADTDAPAETDKRLENLVATQAAHTE